MNIVKKLKRHPVYLAIIAFAVVALLLINFVFGASFNSIEVENISLSGPVSIESNSSASNGNFVLFGSEPIVTDGEIRPLQVSGRHIVNDREEIVFLRGADLLRSEWDLNMSFERRAIPHLANTWKANVIKRGYAANPIVDENFSVNLFGNTITHDVYMSWLDEYVSLAEANNMYIIFSFRSYDINAAQPNIPNDIATQSLIRLAQRYENNPHVILSLQEEPHDISWEEAQPIFQDMVNQINASVGSNKPIIMVPGMNWSRELSGAITQPVIADNVVYKTHPHNDSSLFQQQFIDAYDAGLPVFIGNYGPVEFGGLYDQDMDDIEVLLDWCRQTKIGWIAWMFDEGGGPPLINSNATLEPSDPYGVRILNELLDIDQNGP